MSKPLADYVKLPQLEEYKEWVREPRYVCRKCGMVARREKDLCKPVPIGPRPEEGSPAPGEAS